MFSFEIMSITDVRNLCSVDSFFQKKAIAINKKLERIVEKSAKEANSSTAEVDLPGRPGA